MKKNFIPLFFGAAMAVVGAFQSQTAMADKKKPAADSTAVTTATSKTPEAHKPSKKEKKQSKYAKFFENKKYDSAKGKFISLYKTDGKVYFATTREEHDRNVAEHVNSKLTQSSSSN